MTKKEFILAINEQYSTTGFSSIIWHPKCKKWRAMKVIGGNKVWMWLTTACKHKIQKENGLCG